MTIYTFPAIEPNQSSWGLIANSQVFQSPLSRSVQAIELPGARWKASLTFDHLQRAEYQQINAFLASVRGRSGQFYLYNHAQPSPLGNAGGTPLVKGSAQTGNYLITDGWPNNTLVLKAGDLFKVNSELKICIADATSNGSGEATLNFEPPLRSSPLDNDPIVTDRPTAIFALAADDSTVWSNHQGRFHSIAFDCLEVF